MVLVDPFRFSLHAKHTRRQVRCDVTCLAVLSFSFSNSSHAEVIRETLIGFRCPICTHDLAWKPVVFSCESHMSCTDCVLGLMRILLKKSAHAQFDRRVRDPVMDFNRFQDLLARKSLTDNTLRCPMCQEDARSFKRPLEREMSRILGVRVHCTYENCTDVVQYGDLERHLNVKHGMCCDAVLPKPAPGRRRVDRKPAQRAVIDVADSDPDEEAVPEDEPEAELEHDPEEQEEMEVKMAMEASLEWKRQEDERKGEADLPELKDAAAPIDPSEVLLPDAAQALAADPNGHVEAEDEARRKRQKVEEDPQLPLERPLPDVEKPLPKRERQRKIPKRRVPSPIPNRNQQLPPPLPLLSPPLDLKAAFSAFASL
jgi:hypothetical protein